MQRSTILAITIALCSAVTGLVWYTLRAPHLASPTPVQPVAPATPSPTTPMPSVQPIVHKDVDDKPIGIIRGQVLNAKGEELIGALVTLTRVYVNLPHTEAMTRTVQTDDEGLFTFENLPVRSEPLEPNQRSYYRIEASSDDLIGAENVEPTVQRRDWFIYVGEKPATSITGVVLVDKQLPAAPVSIHALGRGRVQFTRDATSGPAGAFTLGKLPPDRYVVTAIAADFAPLELEVTTLSRDPLNLSLRRGSGILGQVVNAKGEGVPGVTLKSVRESSSAAYERICASDASGRFGLSGLRPGAHRIYLDPSVTKFVLTSAPEIVVVPEKASLEKLTVPVSDAATISGTVVDRATGAGMPHIQVRAESQAAYPAVAYAQTDDKGAFTIPALGAGTYALEPVHPGATGYLVAVPTHAGQTSADLRLELNLSRCVKGVVLDAQGKPVANATVLARNVRLPLALTPGRTYETQTLTDDAGQFVLYPSRDMDTVCDSSGGRPQRKRVPWGP